MTAKYPTLQERAEASRHLPWSECVPSPEWTQPHYYEIARPFQIIYEALIEAGFAIGYHDGVSVATIAHLWGLYKGSEKGYITYNVAEDKYYIIGVTQPDPRPEIPDGVQWFGRETLHLD